MSDHPVPYEIESGSSFSNAVWTESCNAVRRMSGIPGTMIKNQEWHNYYFSTYRSSLLKILPGGLNAHDFRLSISTFWLCHLITSERSTRLLWNPFKNTNLKTETWHHSDFDCIRIAFRNQLPTCCMIRLKNTLVNLNGPTAAKRNSVGWYR